jgi:valyl-tRNA synthetase
MSSGAKLETLEPELSPPAPEEDANDDESELNEDASTPEITMRIASNTVTKYTPKGYEIVGRKFHSEEKDDFDAATTDDPITVASTVRLIWGIAAVLLVFLAFYVFHILFHEQLDEEELENIVLLEDRFERLKALKKYNTQNLLKFFTMVVGALMFGIFFAFGSYMHFRDTKQQEINKRVNIKEKAKDVFHVSEIHILEQENKLQFQKKCEKELEESIEEYEKCKKELNLDALNNKEKIEKLNYEKKRAEEELAKVQRGLKETETVVQKYKEQDNGELISKLQSEIKQLKEDLEKARKRTRSLI